MIQTINPVIRREDLLHAVIFDLDGVLLDTEKLYARFWREAAIELGYPMTHAQAIGMRSLNKAAAQAQLERYFGPGVSHPAMREKRIELMEAYIATHGVELMPGAERVLRKLSDFGFAVGLATSSPIDRVRRYLSPYGLLHYFDTIVTGYDVRNGKPAPDIYILAAEQLGYTPSQCVAVEDSPAGIQSAYHAGCVTVFIPDQDDLDDSIVDKVYAKADILTDLLTVVKEDMK